MQRTMQKSEELYIENPKLDHKLCQDLINYDIIYIQASLGWGKYTFLSHFSEHHKLRFCHQTSYLYPFPDRTIPE